MDMVPKSVFITGCFKGIGQEMVRQFLSMPNLPKHIFATGLDVENSEELMKWAEDHGRLHVKNFDILDYPAYQSIFHWVKSIVGEDGLNLLINNAAVLDTDSFKEVTRDKMMAAFETNAVAPLLIVKNFEPLLKGAASSNHGMALTYSRACVINISSKIGSIDFEGIPTHYPYKVSKAALNMITKSLSCDLSKDGILCIALHPGWVQTDMGGEGALISKEESVSQMLSVMATFNGSDNGTFKDRDGSIILW